MGSELDITIEPWGGVALAMLLDGRESVAVPAWQKNGGPINRFRALPAGPFILTNTSSENTITVRVGGSDSAQDIARFAEGISSMCESTTKEIAPLQAITIVPRKPYLYVNNENATLTLQPVGLLARGPSAMPCQAPISIVWYPN